MTHLLDLDPHGVCAAVKRQGQNRKNPPKTVDELLEAFEQQSLAQAVGALRAFSELL